MLYPIAAAALAWLYPHTLVLAAVFLALIGAALALALLGHEPVALLPRIHELVGCDDATVAEKGRAALEAVEARDP